MPSTAPTPRRSHCAPMFAGRVAGTHRHLDQRRHRRLVADAGRLRPGGQRSAGGRRLHRHNQPLGQLRRHQPGAGLDGWRAPNYGVVLESEHTANATYDFASSEMPPAQTLYRAELIISYWNVTPTPTPTPTSTPTSTFTPTRTPTPTPTATPTPSPTPTITPTPPCLDAYEPDNAWSQSSCW